MNKKDEISKAVSAFRTKIAGAAEGLYEASKIYADALFETKSYDVVFTGVSSFEIVIEHLPDDTYIIS